MSFWTDLFGGGSGDTTKTDLPSWMQPYAKDFLQATQNVANLPYQPYTGQTVAGLNAYQTEGYNAQAQRALQGSPVTDAASGQLQNTMNGMYGGYQAPTNTSANSYNPNAGVMNQYAGAYNPNAGAFNPYAAAYGGDGGYNQNANLFNQYAGSNPYLTNMINQGSEDVVRNFNTAVKPQLESSMVNSGSFGNSGLQQMQAQSQSDLQKNLGDLSQKYRFADYQTQQGLDENRLQRLFGAGQQQSAQRYGAGEAQANRLYGAGSQQVSNLYGAGSQQVGNLYGAGSQQAGNLFSAGSQLAGNQFSAGEGLANRQDSAYQQERARQLQATGLAPSIAGQDYIDAAALQNAGAGFQGQDQAYLTDTYKRFLEARGYPQEQLNTLGKGMGFNFGSQQTTPGTSPASSIAGTAATLWGLNGMGGKS